MPYPNEHSAQIKAPSGFTGFKREADAHSKGVTLIKGINSDGATEVQTVRFDKRTYTPDTAKSWLTAHEYDPLQFEDASPNGHTDGVQHLVRWDRASLRRAQRTPEGFLKADATVTRTGVFEYRNVDGSLRKELRHPDDVMDGVSLDSMKMIPVTNGHPPERIVTSDTARYYTVGATGENIRPDGQFIVSPVVITDGDAIAEIERGRSQVSLGYEVDLLPEKGKFRGDSYDFRQTNIRYNHLALVDDARAGDEAIIHLDSADAMSESIIDGKSEPQSQEEHMGKFNVDGIPYEAAQEVINHVAKETARADTAETALATAKSALETVTGERDAHKAKIDEAEKVDKGTLIQDGVKARRELERKAEKVLKGDEAVKVETLSDRALMEAAVKKVHADADMEGKSDEYVQARFDGVCDAAVEGAGADADTRRKAGGDTESHSDGKDPVGDAQQRMVDRLTKNDKGDKGGEGK